MSEVERSKSGGGAATSGGTTFQEDIACYLSTLILAETKAEPPAGLPQSVNLCDIVAETSQPIDDLQVGTSAGGILYIQAKTSLSLSSNEASEFAKVITQFVRQRLLGARPIGGEARPLDTARDRFILVVGHAAPTTITDSLASVLTKCRPVTCEGRLSELPDSLNAHEVNALVVTRGHIQRTWTTITGAVPTAEEELSVLHLVHVLQLDLRVDGTAFIRARDLLRQVVLRDAERSGDAWAALLSICRSFGPLRTGGDLAYLRAQLQSCGIPIGNVPSFNDDIEVLRKYSADRLAFLRRLSFMTLGEEHIKITREVVEALRGFAQTHHSAVIGEPGAGKSGCVHDLAEQLLADQTDVVLLAADMVRASSPEDLATDLGLSRPRSLVDVLQSWSGDNTGFLIVDALDAARSGMSLHVLCQILGDVRNRAPRWHIVASIREYDLRTSPEVQDLFAGKPHDQFSDPRFESVRHVRIGRLSSAELSQVSSNYSAIAAALQAAPDLNELVTNPFNLSLLCRLIDSHVSNTELSGIHTQAGLLKLYWSRRVETRDLTGRLLVLETAVDQMVVHRELHVARQTLARAVEANTASLDALLSDGVLVELIPRLRSATTVGFAHNILFDYAVYRLWLGDLSDTVLSKLSDPANHDLLLAIRPSIMMAFEALWYDDESRAVFWERANAFERAPGMRLVGKIIAAGVAAQRYRRVPDILPVIEGLRQRNASSAALLRFTIQAASTQHDAESGQRPLIGEGAPQWMALAADLSQHLDQVAWQVRSLLWPMIKMSGQATAEQAGSANRAAVALLRFGLGNPLFRHVVRPGLEVAASTIASDPDSTVSALAELLSEQNVAIGAHEWLHPLAERLHLITEVRPDFALRIVDVVFRTSGDRDAAVPMGGRILALSMNKRDLVGMARRHVPRVYAKIWEQDPVTATRIFLKVMEATAEHEQAALDKPENVCRIPFRGSEATLQPDASRLWTAGEHHRHDEWYTILSSFQRGLTNLAEQEENAARLGQVLDVLRDEAELAVIWSALLEAAATKPQTLGNAVGELLAATEVLTQLDTRKAAGDLIESGYEHFSTERRLAIEAAIMRIPETTPAELQEYAEEGRNRMLGCIPLHLIQSPELKRIRAELDATGGAPPNEPGFSMSVSWERSDDDWWLREQGVKPEKEENSPLLELSKAVSAISCGEPGERFTAEAAAHHLSLLQEAEAALQSGRNAGADLPLVEHVESEVIHACARLAAADGLRRDMPLAVFIRTTLRRGATAECPEHRPESDKRWDKDLAGWSSPSPRIDAAMGLMWLAANAETVDDEILSDVGRLAEDVVPAVRFQVISHCRWLYRTAPEVMWLLIERTCAGEPRTGILTTFASAVLLRLPPQDYERVEPEVRRLYRRCRRNQTFSKVRQACITFYLRGALWRRDDRAARYICRIARSPIAFAAESSTIIGHCRGLIRYNDGDSDEENKRVRKWAFSYLTRVVTMVLAIASKLRQKNANASLDQWAKEDVEDLRLIHQLTHNVATELYFGSGAFDTRDGSQHEDGDRPPPSDAEKSQLLAEGRELFDALCDIEFVDAAYDVLQTLEFLIGVDYPGIILRVATLVRRAEGEGIQYESLAADLIVRIVERYLSEYGNLIRENTAARMALLDILDVFAGAGWPAATRLTYRLGEVFR